MNLKIFTDNIEESAKKQINTLLSLDAFKDCKVRIMPDVHAGAGCVIGFTADLGDKVIPNIVGVDIGCGMLTTELLDKDIDFQRLDRYIKQNIPSGLNVHQGSNYVVFDKLKELYCYDHLRNVDWLERSLGTLGGGNHFIEVDRHERSNRYYLVIHTGSRNVGYQVAEYYQHIAVESMKGNIKISEERKKLVEKYKAEGREKEIEGAVKELSKQIKSIQYPKELCYLTGEYRERYLHDMKICQEFAVANRKMIADTIISKMGWTVVNRFETIHNYIDLESNIVRKGAISAKRGEMLLIPINMRDGSIIGIGKGNEDWNFSAPHGAGRLMSRKEAKRTLTVGEFKRTMEGIYTTTVGFDTLDEAPMAYKPMDEIIENIEPTVEIIYVIKPAYNFKAAE